MRFEKFIPILPLQPYIKHFVLSENEVESDYKVFPSPGIVMGFQYKGKLSSIVDNNEIPLANAGITGISDSYKVFKNSPVIGTVLVFFTETGFIHFASHPAHELFNLSISLEHVFDKSKILETEEKLCNAKTDRQRIHAVERFLLAHLKEKQTDKLVVEAVRLIYQSKGTIRIKELNKKLLISQSPFEKRFRKLVGISPKKFSSIVRFNTVLNTLGSAKSLAEICYENNFFDQAHFIKDFKQYTGSTPDDFKSFL